MIYHTTQAGKWAVAGAAITTGITTPVTPSGPPPRTADSPLKGVLRASAGRVSCPHPLRLAARRRKAADTGRVPWGQGAVPGQSPSGYPWESPGADLVLLHAPCHAATHGQCFAPARLAGKSGGGPKGAPPFGVATPRPTVCVSGRAGMLRERIKPKACPSPSGLNPRGRGQRPDLPKGLRNGC